MEYPPAFQRAINFILPHEEEFLRGHWGDENYVISENVPGDSGGLTKYGIDQASHHGVDIEHLTKDGAIAIYYMEWLHHNLNALPDLLAVAMFDVWVNGGHAVLWLQEALNATAASHLTTDGQLGPCTLQMASTCDPKPVLQLFLQERDARFKAIATNNPQDQQFLNGWLQRDNDLRQYLLGDGQTAAT